MVLNKIHIKRKNGYWTVTSRAGILRYVYSKETAFLVAKAYYRYM